MPVAKLAFERIRRGKSQVRDGIRWMNQQVVGIAERWKYWVIRQFSLAVRWMPGQMEG